MERKQGVCATRRRRSKWETLSVTSYNIIMVKKRSLPLPPPPHTPSPLFFPSLISLMVLWTLAPCLLTYVFCRPRQPPTPSQPYLLIFFVRPAYLQHCLSPTYLCFMSSPLTSNTVTVYLLMFSVGPAYLQHCHSLLEDDVHQVEQN